MCESADCSVIVPVALFLSCTSSMRELKLVTMTGNTLSTGSLFHSFKEKGRLVALLYR